MLNIGWDWGSEKHAICLMSENRRSLARFEITNDLEGIRKVVSQVEALGFQPEECAVALEGRPELLILALSSLGFTIPGQDRLSLESQGGPSLSGPP